MVITMLRMMKNSRSLSMSSLRRVNLWPERTPSTSDAAHGGGGKPKVALFENAPVEGEVKRYKAQVFEVQSKRD